MFSHPLPFTLSLCCNPRISACRCLCFSLLHLHLQKRFMAYVDHTAYQDIAGFLPAYMDLSTRIWIFFSSPCLVGFLRAFNFFLSSSGFRSDFRFLPCLFGLRSDFLFVPLLIWLSPPPFLSWIFPQIPLNSIYNS